MGKGSKDSRVTDMERRSRNAGLIYADTETVVKKAADMLHEFVASPHRVSVLKAANAWKDTRGLSDKQRRSRVFRIIKEIDKYCDRGARPTDT